MKNKVPSKATLIFHKRLSHVVIIISLILMGLASFKIMDSNTTIVIGSIIVLWNIIKLRSIDTHLANIKG
jgi:hypothetical protein